jgi:dihydroorotase (multifunctional complex type)
MPIAADLLIRGGTVVSSHGRTAMDVVARDGRIVALLTPGTADVTARETLEAGGLLVLPGIIDGHVHFREPGFTWKEDITSGSHAAVMGGVTTVLEMPNTDPATDSVEHAALKASRVPGRSWCDIGLIGVATETNTAELRPMAEAGLVVGFKAFLGPTTGGIEVPSDGAVLDALAAVRDLGMRLGFHAESGAIVAWATDRVRATGRTDPLAHLDGRPALAEEESVNRMALFALRSGCPIHIFHLTSAPGLAAVEAWRARGADITCEVGPQHVFLGAEEMPEVGSRMRINPPIRLRAEGHGDALFHGVARGTVTAIATDHSPHTREEKLHDDIWQAVSGYAGVETSLALFLTLGVGAGRLTLEQLVRATSEGPARTWGLWPRKGWVGVGADADLTLVDPDRPGVVDEAALHGRSSVTPFHGWATRGAPVATVVRGQMVMREGALHGEPIGRLVARV